VEGGGVKAALHGLALAVAAWVFAQPLAVTPAAVASGVGAFLGAVAADVAARQRMRLSVRLLGPLLGALAGWLLAGLIARFGVGASIWGPHVSLVFVETLRWGVTACAVALVLRALALEYRPLLVLETVTVAVALAVPWASHREGMIARPLELSDWFWSHNLDPVWGFVGLGIASAVIVSALWLRPRRAVQGGLALLAVLLLALPLGWWIQRGASPTIEAPPPGGGGGGGSSESEGRSSESDRRYEEQTQPSERPKQPVAVMVLHRDVEPLGGIFYLRATAFSQFNGVRLIRSTRDDVDPGVPRRFPTADPVRVPAPPAVELRETVATDVALMVPQDRPLALADPVRLEAKRNRSPRFRRQYHVVSETLRDAPESLLGRNPGDPSWSLDAWEHYTAMPDDPRYVELVTRLADRLETRWSDDPWAIALAIREYLEAETTYAFDGTYGGSTEDPTADFLFSEEKRGYCVHLAHSAALLLRARGIPSRVSAGYAVEANRRGNGSAILVRNVDAHAWAELYLAGVGWVPLEVVPESVDADLTPFEEEDLQQLLGEMAREEGRLDPVPERSVDLLAQLRAVAEALPLVALAVVSLLLAARELRAQRYRFAGPRASRWGYRSALDALALHGWRRAHGESREAFARRVEGAAPSFARLSRVFLEDRLAERPPRARDPRVVRLTRDSRAEAATSAPRWRRALAWIDPVSWLLSR
jgi:transglutaminase-like putative cysteine protease